MTLGRSWGWHHFHAWFTVLHALLGAPLWYRVYLTSETPETVASDVTQRLTNTVPEWALIGVLVVFMLALFGPPVAMMLGDRHLSRVGDGIRTRWVFAAFLGMQLWPLQIVAAWAHWRASSAVETPADIDGAPEVIGR